jgi:tetratricopeptide (TPR) repeat protein
MPQAATDIAHVAFTHHRIGVHTGDVPQPPTGQIVDLVPFDDVSHFSRVDRDRNLGLAYVALSRRQIRPAAIEIYFDRALTLLERVRAQGLPDAEVTAALAQIYWARDPQTAFHLACEALESETLSASSRVNSLFVAGDAGLATNRLDEARKALEKLVTQRRLSEDWLLLAQCRQRGGDLPAALRDLTQAAAIAPFRPHIHEALAQLHEQMGEAAAAAKERALASQLGKQAGRK